MLRIPTVFAFVVFAAAQDNKELDRVTSLPGFDGKSLPSAWYSGYLAVNSGKKMLHFLLQEADDDAASKPLLLWLNGGPGASSLIGAFTELGQLVFNSHSQQLNVTASGGTSLVPRLFRNPYSWTTVANVLYLEAPAGVGFSYCVDPDSSCVSNDTSTARENHEALVAFLQRFPEYARRPKFLTGESYAGIYLPMLMDEIERRGEVSNVSGAAIGNGCWGTVAGTNCGDLLDEPGTVYRVDKEYFLGRGLISPVLAAAADRACGDWADPLPAKCEAAYRAISAAVGSFNIDNVDDACPGAGLDSSLHVFRTSGWEQRLVRRNRGHATSGNRNVTVGSVGPVATPVIGEQQLWCGAEHASQTWQQLPEVQRALHVAGPGSRKHAFDYNIERLDLRALYRRFASDTKLNFVVYNGLSDANVPWNGQVRYWAQNFSVPQGKEWQPWSVGGRNTLTSGHVRSYSETFKFITVNGAGHEVPTYRPAAALAMLKQFVL